ncbi:MAG: class I SAM-dependent methyltransferase [Nitrososphaerota archaeon]|nr:class I SAM-dependent methyltransferase [Nitrososphaerota archaeon]
MANEMSALERLLAKVANGKEGISIVEIGCGTGRVLSNISPNPELLNRLVCAIGVDKSWPMIEVARKNLQKTNSRFLAEKTSFLLMDATDLRRFFPDGDVRSRVIGSLPMNNDVLHIVRTKYKSSRKIVCCLLNTIGIVSANARATLIDNMVACAGSKGILVVSVFSHRAFKKHAPLLYGSMPGVIGERGLRREYFNFKSATFSAKSYYSHWFKNEEITNLLTEHGCKLVRHVELANMGALFTARVDHRS